jgi:GNAT superfamily N-acetyltransferase
MGMSCIDIFRAEAENKTENKNQLLLLGDDPRSKELARLATEQLIPHNFGPEETADAMRLAEEVSNISDPEYFDKNQYCFVLIGENLETENPTIKGVSIGHYLAESKTAALWYLAVSPEHRRQNLGQQLVGATDQVFEQMAEARGNNKPPVFVHIHDPEEDLLTDDPFDATQRVKFYNTVGAQRVPIRFVVPNPDPELSKNGDVVPYMLISTGKTPETREIEAHIDDYYRVYGVEPDGHTAVQNMVDQLKSYKGCVSLPIGSSKNQMDVNLEDILSNG